MISSENITEELPGMVSKPQVKDLPVGYVFGVTRYADVIMKNAFPTRWKQFIDNLNVNFQAFYA